MDALRTSIIANLAGFPRAVIDPKGLRRAAVAIVLSPVDGAPTYVLTRRALSMRRGAGNYALPGGNFEPGEDGVAAAIRETNEELGVSVAVSGALGLLDDFVTLGGHVVTPVVLWSGVELTLRPDPREVHEAWRVPLAELDHPDAPKHDAHADDGRPILQMFVQGKWINPPTAAWLYQFREVALHGRHTRIASIGQPSWTAH